MFNSTRLNAIADAIENKRHSIGFNMNSYLSSELHIDNKGEARRCNTEGCIAGHALYMFHDNPFGILYDHMFVARGLLGLSIDQSHELFMADSLNRGTIADIINSRLDGDASRDSAFAYINARKADVPNALRWMSANNDINWRRAFAAIDETNRRIEAAKSISTYEVADELETV